MRTITRPLAAAVLLSAAFLGGTADAGCVAPDVCYRNVTLVDECIDVTDAGCTQVRVEAPLCVGGSMWETVFCWW